MEAVDHDVLHVGVRKLRANLTQSLFGAVVERAERRAGNRVKRFIRLNETKVNRPREVLRGLS